MIQKYLYFLRARFTFRFATTFRFDDTHPEAVQHLLGIQYLAMKTNLHPSTHVRLHFEYFLVIFNLGGKPGKLPLRSNKSLSILTGKLIFNLRACLVKELREFDTLLRLRTFVRLLVY